MIFRTFILLSALCALLSAQAAIYYVSPLGDNGNAGSESEPWLTISYAVQGRGSYLQPGDTVLLRGGLYSGNANAIDLGSSKSCSGTSNAPITIKAYPGETPIICDTTSPYYALIFNSKASWIFDGLTWSNCYASAYMANLTNCVWTNCTFGWMPGGGVAADTDPPAGWANVKLAGASFFNRFQNCSFRDWGQIHTNESSAYQFHIFGTHLEFGDETADDMTWFNLVEGCTFARAGHDLVETVTGYNVYRNNLFHNEPFIPTNAFLSKLYNWGAARTNPNPYGAWSPRIMKPGDSGTYQVDLRNVWESNRFYYTGPPADSPGSHAIELGTSQNIYRFNSIAYALATAIAFNTSGSGHARSNAVYHNTIFGCGLATQYGGTYEMQVYGGIATLNTDHAPNFIVNNIIWKTSPYQLSGDTVTYQQCRTNFTDQATDPLFISTNGWGYTYNAASLPDFRLRAGSPCIDAGTWLTYCPSSGSGTTLVLTNSLYFSDGNRIVPGDTIQLQGQTATSQVLSNDFARNTLYLSAPMTWAAGQGVSLAYSGSAPDQGAFESATPQDESSVRVSIGTLRVETMTIGTDSPSPPPT